ncbi:MAG: class I SAM-dependent methyltransferase [Chlorobia bacterium]|nr:class I SAM-dependent methyltransferase [Fimbriimonadaceae bacterium]
MTLRDDGRNAVEIPLDGKVAKRFGAYASFTTPDDPIRVDFFGDPPNREFNRLLDGYADKQTQALDLGCGAGFTLCRIADRVQSIVGVDLQSDLLQAAEARIRSRGIKNARVVHGDTTHDETVTKLEDGRFSLAFSQRGPFLTRALASKLTPDAVFVVELAQDYLGLKQIFGRTPFVPQSTGDPDWAVGAQAGAGFVPVSAKSYWYHEYFRNADHLAAYLRRGACLENWWMEPCPYEEPRDRAALELWCRYNQDESGIRLVVHRKVYVFRRQAIDYYPATLSWADQ